MDDSIITSSCWRYLRGCVENEGADEIRDIGELPPCESFSKCGYDLYPGDEKRRQSRKIFTKRELYIHVHQTSEKRCEEPVMRPIC